MMKFSSPSPTARPQKTLKHKRRYCRYPDCTRIVKSQGLCQRHGAKPRGCKVEGCPKQAQGSFDGMCKSHFKCYKSSGVVVPLKTNLIMSVCSVAVKMPPPPPPPPPAVSVYETVLPASIGYHCSGPPEQMPLIKFLVEGAYEHSPAWHRNEERRVRGLAPSTTMDLDEWERDLAQMEIILLTGNPAANFELLEQAWGQEPGFCMDLVRMCCESRVASIQEQSGNNHNNYDKNNSHSRRSSKMSSIGNSVAVLKPNHRRQMSSLSSIPMGIWDDTSCKDVGSNMDLFDLVAYAAPHPNHHHHHQQQLHNEHHDRESYEASKVLSNHNLLEPHRRRGEPYTDETEACTSSSSSESEPGGDDEWAVAASEEVVW